MKAVGVSLCFKYFEYFATDLFLNVHDSFIPLSYSERLIHNFFIIDNSDSVYFSEIFLGMLPPSFVLSLVEQKDDLRLVSTTLIQFEFREIP